MFSKDEYTEESRFEKFKEKYKTHLKAAALGVSLGVAVGVTVAVKDRLDVTNRLQAEVTLLHRENEILSKNQVGIAQVLEQQGLITNLTLEDI